MALADLVHDVQKPFSADLNSSMDELDSRLKELEGIASEKLLKEGAKKEALEFEHYLNLRYVGSDTTFMISRPTDGQTWADAFTEEHRRQFSFIMAGRSILIENVRVRATAKSTAIEPELKLDEQLAASPSISLSEDKVANRTRVFFEGGWYDAPIYFLTSLEKGTKVQGPAIILDNTQTIVVSPESQAIILERHVVLELQHKAPITAVIDENTPVEARKVDPAQLTIFGHRFMSIAEQMGHALQKTSVSVNIKERLDFSCALFSPDGRLVANAPHVPVHLGSMEQAVMFQHNKYSGQLRPGDVIVANHPISGGTHLPDITCITPNFDAAGKEITFYFASRGHHQEIGKFRSS